MKWGLQLSWWLIITQNSNSDEKLSLLFLITKWFRMDEIKVTGMIHFLVICVVFTTWYAVTASFLTKRWFSPVLFILPPKMRFHQERSKTSGPIIALKANFFLKRDYKTKRAKSSWNAFNDGTSEKSVFENLRFTTLPLNFFFDIHHPV